MDSKTFLVPNISCGHCVRTVETELSELKGVRAVKANEKTKQVKVEWEGPATWTAIEKLLTDIDYAPTR